MREEGRSGDGQVVFPSSLTKHSLPSRSTTRGPVALNSPQSWGRDCLAQVVSPPSVLTALHRQETKVRKEAADGQEDGRPRCVSPDVCWSLTAQSSLHVHQTRPSAVSSVSTTGPSPASCTRAHAVDSGKPLADSQSPAVIRKQRPRDWIARIALSTLR